MKKLVLSTVAALAMTSAAFAQGNVNWGSISAAAMTSVTNSSTYSSIYGNGGAVGGGATGATLGGAVTGASFYWALLTLSGAPVSAPTTAAGLAAWSNTGLSATNSNTAGRLAVVNPNTGQTVSWSPGTTNNVMMAGWSANLGNTLAAAMANAAAGTYVGQAFFGLSTTGYITTLSTATSPGAAVFGTAPTAQGTPIFSLNTPLYLVSAVPEPGTMVLAGLGGLAMLALRRKK